MPAHDDAAPISACLYHAAGRRARCDGSLCGDQHAWRGSDGRRRLNFTLLSREYVVRTVSPPCLCPLSVSCVSLCVCLSLTHISHSLITVFIKRASGLVAKQFPEIHESERETERHTQRDTRGGDTVLGVIWRATVDPGRLHRGGCRGKRRGLETQLRGCRLSADPMLTLAQGCSPV